MTEFLLSQAELDTLMEQNYSSFSDIDQQLKDFFQPMGSLLEKQLRFLLGSAIIVDGFYIEKLVELPDIQDQAYIYPVEFQLGDSYVMILQSDVSLLATYLNVSISKSLTVIVEEMVAVLSEFLTEQTDYWQRPYIYEPVLVEASQLRSLSVGPSHRARFNVNLNDKGVELFWFLTDSIVQDILASINEVQTKEPKRFHKPTIDHQPSSKAVKVKPFRFTDLEQEIKESKTQHQIELVKDVKIELTAELGQSLMTLGDIMQLKVGDFIKLHKTAGEPADLFAMGQQIATAEVTIVDDHFGLRVLAMDSVKNLINY